LKSDLFVSVVLVIDQPLSAQESVLHNIQSDLELHYSDYEVVVVGQGPVLGGAFTSQDEAVLERIPGLRYIQLAARVYLDVALATGLENAIGDFNVIFDPEVDPISAISESVDMCHSGFDVVVGVANQPCTFMYRIFRSMSNGILSAIGYSLPRNATGLRCLSRRAMNSILLTGRSRHQIYMQIQRTGYFHAVYNYVLLSGKMRPRSLVSGLKDMIHLLVFNSSRPLRWMSAVGLLGSFFAFIFAAYSVLIHLVKRNVVEGWTTSILFMSVLFMMQFIMMAFFGEYLGRLLDDRSDMVDRSVAFEKCSLVIINQDRVNVLKNSLDAKVKQDSEGKK
jgi:polyisoprenyl-phosphate glycosyltransferase